MKEGTNENSLPIELQGKLILEIPFRNALAFLYARICFLL